MKPISLAFAMLLVLSGPVSAQGVMRCERSDGKVEYAESCSAGDKSREVKAPREPERREVDAQRKKTERDEAAFQKRHAAREKLAAQERRDRSRIARDNARTKVMQDRAELAKAREKRLAEQNIDKAPRKPKNAPAR